MMSFSLAILVGLYQSAFAWRKTFVMDNMHLADSARIDNSSSASVKISSRITNMLESFERSDQLVRNLRNPSKIALGKYWRKRKLQPVMDNTHRADSARIDNSSSAPIKISSPITSMLKSFERSGQFVRNLLNPSNEALAWLAPGSTLRTYWRKFVKLMSAADWGAARTTFAKVAVWGTGLALTIVFPPSILGSGLIVAGSTLFIFLISALNLYRSGKFNLSSLSRSVCLLGSEMARNILVGLFGGVTGGLPALILSADVLDMMFTEWKQKPGVATYLFKCTGQNLGEALEQIRAQGGKRAIDILHALPKTVDPTMGLCRCEDCKYDTRYCEESICLPFMYKKCEVQYENCTVLSDCFDKHEQEMKKEELVRLGAGHLLKADERG